jgi:vacuolar protein sorting-associated protein 52
MESIDQYMENSQQVLDLHKQMQDCDAVLARMQEMLLGFQADLGGISEEIKYLQDESLSMSICLKNKKAAEEKLRYFLENAAISGDMVNSVVNGPVNELFLESIVALSVRLKFLKSPPSSFEIPVAETAAGQSLQPELAKLKLKAIVKSKEYFTNQFQALRKPKTNIQMLQQNSLVKFAPLYHFLSREAPSVADELKSIYIDSMNRTILNLFKNYSSQLAKLELSFSSKTDTIAIEEAAMKAAMKANISKKSDPFAIGDRHMLLDRIEDEPILVHVAIAESQKYPYEVLFRSIIKHLIDSACNEFLFILDFFKCAPSDSFGKIFGKTISMILENLENFLLNCYDSVGLLLMIKSSYAQHLIMQRRRIPVLDSLFDRISLLLWPRFKFILDLNIKSIRGISIKKIGNIS